MVMAKLQYVYFAKGIYPRFRHPKTGDVPLPRDIESAEFHQRYSVLLVKVQADGPLIDRQSFNWLVKKYQDSAEFRALAGPTQIDYAKTLELMAATLGDFPFRFISRAVIKALRDKHHAATPRKADKIRQMASGLYTWADQADLVPPGFNPAKGIKQIKRRKNMFMPWSDGEISKAVSLAPPHIKTPLLIALYTGQRAKDICEMTWRQVEDRLWVRQSKTDELIDIPCHPVLRAHLDEIKPDVGGIICWSKGNRPYNSDSLGAALRDFLRPIGITERSLHGIRFAVAVILNDLGCSPAVCSAILGHQTYEMAMRYMSRKLNADNAVKKMQKLG
jgi:integrase